MARVAKESSTLVSSTGTGYFYVNRKNKKKAKGDKKLKLRKYDPIARKHVLFEEKKLSKLKQKFDPNKAKNAQEATESTPATDKKEAA